MATDPLKPDLDPNEYHVGHQLGQGGTAAVYFGRLLAEDLDVAIKCWKRGFEFRSKREEAALKALHQLTHKNVLGYVASVVDRDGRRCIVSHYVKGVTLQSVIDALGSIELVRALGIANEIAGALIETTKLGLVHRDVKPSNVMLGRTPAQPNFKNLPTRAILIDFGLVLGPVSDGRRTEPGEVIASAVYCAPEQLEAAGDLDDAAAAVGPAADVHGLGMTLLAMLVGTGQSTFGSRETALASAIDRGVPDDVLALARRCVAINPDHRPLMAEVARALRALLTRYERRRPRRLGCALALTLATLLSAAGSFGWAYLGSRWPALADPMIAIRDARAGFTPNIMINGPEPQEELVQKPFVEGPNNEGERSQDPVSIGRMTLHVGKQERIGDTWQRTFVLRAAAGIDCGALHSDPRTPRNAWVFPKLLLPLQLTRDDEPLVASEVAIVASFSFTTTDVLYEPAADGNGFVKRPGGDRHTRKPGPDLRVRIGEETFPLTEAEQCVRARVAERTVDVVVELGHRPENNGEMRAPFVGVGCLGWSPGPHTPRWVRGSLELTIEITRPK